ncbi:hypothetical protein ACFL54_08585, partial [Planctomycetota bacterium]
YYFDVESFLLVKRERITRIDRRRNKEEEYFYDYRRVGDFQLPLRSVIFYNGVLAIEEDVSDVKINVNISEELFVYPEGED